jgi:hypothetical protein
VIEEGGGSFLPQNVTDKQQSKTSTPCQTNFNFKPYTTSSILTDFNFMPVVKVLKGFLSSLFCQQCIKPEYLRHCKEHFAGVQPGQVPIAKYPYIQEISNAEQEMSSDIMGVNTYQDRVVDRLEFVARKLLQRASDSNDFEDLATDFSKINLNRLQPDLSYYSPPVIPVHYKKVDRHMNKYDVHYICSILVTNLKYLQVLLQWVALRLRLLS